MKDIVVIGSGGFSKQVIEIIEQHNLVEKEYNLIGIIDDNESLIGSKVLAYEVIGNTDFLKDYSRRKTVHGIIAIGDGEIRQRLVKKLDSIKWVNLIHPSATVTNYKQLGTGNVICGGVVVNPGFVSGNHCHINIGTTLGHDVKMLDYVTVMPGCRLSGNVILKTNSTIGTGSTIIQGLTVEESVTLGAGAVLVRSTEPDNLYLGVPAEKKT